jgi:ribose/xylose/arabinose/galactoside ABC-type transport system permease subunit
LTKLKGIGWLAEFKLFNVSISFFIWLFIGIVLVFLLRKTIVGSRLYAIGGNEIAAKFSGINVSLWKIVAFSFSSLCGGLAALIYSSRLASIEAAQAGGYELMAVAVAVIGGTNLKGGKGSITGTILASIIFVVLLNMISLLGLVSWYKDVILGIVIIGTVIMNKI